MDAMSTAETPLASVVVCSYNYGRFLSDAIDSALDQTYENVEVIVVDDGSTDDSREIIRRYGDRVLPILKANEGHDAAVNSGFMASRGHVVCFLDSDDGLFPTAMEQAVDAMRAEDVVKVHWPLCIVDKDGGRTGQLLPRGTLPDGDLRDVVLALGPQGYLSPPTSGNAWARPFLERVCPLTPMENRAGTADDQLSMLAPLFGLVRTLPSQGFFRAHGGNNYWGHTLDHLGMTIRDYDRYCAVLSSACHRLGIAADSGGWKRESWFYRLNQALQDTAAVMPAGHTCLLVDDEKWGSGEWIAGCRRIPFPERNGKAWGRPLDDDDAIRELERLRGSGADYLLIGWPAFWWIDSYPGWYRRVQSIARCLLSNERVMLFDLRSAGVPGESR
jgi:glycosyltransferase involved in cell wall biosynthesis